MQSCQKMTAPLNWSLESESSTLPVPHLCFQKGQELGFSDVFKVQDLLFWFPKGRSRGRRLDSESQHGLVHLDSYLHVHPSLQQFVSPSSGNQFRPQKRNSQGDELMGKQSIEENVFRIWGKRSEESREFRE